MLFLLSTALAVASTFLPTTNALMSCQNTVNGVLYNLEPLHALGDIKVTPATGAYDYYINVCGAVQGPCASHPSAFSCQVRKSPPDQFEAVNAYSDVESHAPAPTWGPSASETGGVKLTFTNGDTCNLRQRVMNIDFQCDYNGTRAITIVESPQCTYNIIYPTKVVCQAPTTAAPTTAAPTTAAPTTHAPTSTPTPTPAVPEMMSCNHTINGTKYDLTPLHALGDIKVTPSMGAYDYYINVCGAVSAGQCGSHPSAFACQVRKSPPDQFEAVQAYSDKAPEPTWGPSAGETGGVKLQFTNGDSCNLRQRIMNIDFQCDETGTRAITIDENPQCTFNVVYPTKVVCPGYVPPTTAAPTTAAPTTKAPTTEAPTTAAPTTHAPTSTPTSTPTPAVPDMMSCNHTINGTFYDLSPLHALGDVKVTPLSGAYDYYISVCGAVSIGRCAEHPDAFACQVRKSPPDQFESVVAYTNTKTHAPEPTWGPSASETGGAKLVFTNGDSCNLRQRVMNIDFQCDENGTLPITVDENPQCTFNFKYPTKVVCPGYVPPTTAAPTTAAPTTKAPTTAAPTTAAPTTEAPTTHAPTSTPTSASASSTYDENTITRAGLGAGIGIGIGCLAVVWLLWCCYDRRRVQQQVQNADAYAPLTSSSV